MAFRGAQYKAVTFDPKTAIDACDTLMLDMDGTILDLAYDNYMWMTHVPERWAEQNGMPIDEARKYLLGKFGAAEGDLRWYCLDHWSEHLGLDVAQLHRDNHHLIDYLPGGPAQCRRLRHSAPGRHHPSRHDSTSTRHFKIRGGRGRW